VTVFRNRGQFARFDDALAYASAHGQVPDLAPVRRRQDRLGIAFNAEQEVTDVLGLFLRGGWSDGRIETYDFTDIDRTLALGGSLAGGAGAGRRTPWAWPASSTAFPPRTSAGWRPAASACWSAMARCPIPGRSRSWKPIMPIARSAGVH
jgi:hypothetical protein